MALTNLDNEKDNLLNLVNGLAAVEQPVTQDPIEDAEDSVEETDPTVTEFNALVAKVNEVIAAMVAYGVINASD